jgi:L-tartrate/succinate antiporter
MLWTGVLEWNDITSNKAAWNTFVWFATLVALADGLSSTGFIAWLGKEGGSLMGNVSPGVATIVLLLAFYLLHYLFASTTAHTTALLPAMLTIASTIPGMNMQVFVLVMVTSLGVMGLSPLTVPVRARFTTVAATCPPKTTGVWGPFSVPSSWPPCC